MNIRSPFRFFVCGLFLFLLIKPSCTRGEDSQSNLAIPKSIVAEARRRLIPLSAIQLRGSQWVACMHGERQGESCITLGGNVPKLREPGKSEPSEVDATRSLTLNYGDQITIEQFGRKSRTVPVSRGTQFKEQIADVGNVVRGVDESLQLTILNGFEAKILVTGRNGRQALDTLPRFRRESPRLVRTSDIGLVKSYMSQHPNEPYLVVVTVPSQCEPCRRLDLMLSSYQQGNQQGTLAIKMFILEYFSFGEAEVAALGQGAVFPTTIVFPRAADLPKTAMPRLAYGISSAGELETISKRISSTFDRRPTSVARGSISHDSLTAMLRTVNLH